MITLDQAKVDEIRARRNARPAHPEPLVSTHTIERVYYEPSPQSPKPDWSFRDVMHAVEERERHDVPVETPIAPATVVEPVVAVGISTASPEEILSAAVRAAIANAADNQRRYELAVQARNGKAEAMTLVELEAIERGVTIGEMVQIIIDQRADSERRTMQIIAAEVRWRRAISEAGDGAADVANAAAAELATL